jgi:hypothetical protein
MQTSSHYTARQSAAYIQPPTAYTHRRNPDGTTESVCRKCFTTVVTASRDADLDNAEHSHLCDPKALDHWNDVIERDKRRWPRQFERYQ